MWVLGGKMTYKLIEAKCPYCKKEHDSFKHYHKGVGLLGGEYASKEVTQTCDYCGEKFILSLTETRRYSAKKIK